MVWGRIKQGANWARSNPGGALAAAATGGISLIPGVGGFLMGEKAPDPSTIALPPGYDEALQRRDGVLAQFQRQARGMDSPAMQRAGVLGERLAQQQQSQAAGVRGFGALGALQSAARNTALGQQNIAAGANIQAGQEQRAAQNVLLQAANQDIQRAFMEDQYRRAIAEGEAVPGALPALLGTIGTGIGGYFGGVEGAAAGGQAGYGIGQAGLAARGY